VVTGMQPALGAIVLVLAVIALLHGSLIPMLDATTQPGTLPG
jgi:hypothetical protein